MRDIPYSREELGIFRYVFYLIYMFLRVVLAIIGWELLDTINTFRKEPNASLYVQADSGLRDNDRDQEFSGQQ